MNVAVGRLHLSVSMRTSVRDESPSLNATPINELEEAFLSGQRLDAVEADRTRWTTEYRFERGPNL